MSSEVEETLKRLQNHKGVLGIVIVNNDGIPIRTTLSDPLLTTQYSALLSQLTYKARNAVRELDATNDLTFLRVRTKKHEIMVAPGIFIGRDSKSSRPLIIKSILFVTSSYSTLIILSIIKVLYILLVFNISTDHKQLLLETKS